MSDAASGSMTVAVFCGQSAWKAQGGRKARGQDLRGHHEIYHCRLSSPSAAGGRKASGLEDDGYVTL